MKHILLVVVMGLLQVSLHAQKTMNLLFLGDVMGHDGQLESAYNAITGEYEFDSCFSYISHIFARQDFTIANLEVTLNSKPYKGYPSFSSPASLAGALQRSGVNVMVTANNHSCDRGKQGILRTVRALDSLGIVHTGVFTSQKERAAKHPLLLQKNGIRVALLNYTYGTNGIPIPAGTFVNLIDTAQIRVDLQKAKKMQVDKSIVFIHWGTEYELHPNKEQERLAAYIIQMGADIIIGSHPHVVQRAEFSQVQQTFVVYSLGNFISNQRTQPRDAGMMIQLQLEKKNNETIIRNPGYILTWVYTPTELGKRKFYVLPVAEYEKSPEFFDNSHSYSKMMSTMDIIRPVLEKYNVEVPEVK